MTNRLTEVALRAALQPAPEPDAEDVVRAIGDRIRATSQRRVWLAWPWQAQIDATWPQARRAGLIRMVALGLLVLAAVAAAAVGARLVLRQTAPPQLLFLRGGQFATVAADGQAGRTPLAFAGRRLRDFNVSPDGSRIATLSEDGRLEIWDAPEVLGDAPAVPVVIPILPDALPGFGMDWIPGRDALLMNLSDHGLHRLYVVDVASRTWQPIGPDDLAVTSYWPAPDARHVAIVGQLRGAYGLWAADLSSGAVRQVVGAKDGVIPVTDVTWAPGSDRLAFSGQPSGTNFVAVFVVSLDGTGLARLTPYAEHAVGPTWSPNGAWIAYLRDAGTGVGCYIDLAVVRPDGTDARLVAHDSLPVAWTTDSSGLIVETDRSLAGAPLGAMAELGLDGSTERVILPLDASDGNNWLCHPRGALTHWYGGRR